MTTNNPTTIKIVVPDAASPDCMLIAERGGLATMVGFSLATDDEEYPVFLGDVLPGVLRDALDRLIDIEAAPPPDIAIEDPKPAPAPAAKAATPKKQTPAKPAAPPPPPVKAKWWTNEDTGAVKRDDGPKMDTDGWLGPFDTEAEAEANIPEWLKSAFGGKSKSKKR